MSIRLKLVSFVVTLKTIASMTIVFSIVPFFTLHSLNSAFAQSTHSQTDAERFLEACRQDLKNEKFQAALQDCHQAAEAYKAIADFKIEWKARVNLANAYLNLENYHQAIATAQQAFDTAKKIDDTSGQSKSLANIALAYDYLGKYDQAITYYQQWLAIAQASGDKIGMSKSLGNLGLAYENLNNYDKAFEYYQRWLAIAIEIKDRLAEGKALTNIGLIYDYMGKYDLAIASHLKSLEIALELNDRHLEGSAYGNIGITYQNLGKYDKAIESYQKSLTIAKASKDRPLESSALGNLGNIYFMSGNYPKAIEYHQQNLAIAQSLKDRQAESIALGNLGNVNLKLQKYTEAINFYNRQLAIAQDLKDKLGEGSAYGNLGIVYQDLGEYNLAFAYQQKYLAISREIKNRQGESYSLNSMALIMELQKQPELAILFYKQSVSVRESIRKDIRGLRKEDQQSFARTVSHTYRQLADLLLKRGRVTEALQVLDLLKVQELEDYLKNIQGNERTTQGIELLEPEKAISRDLLTISNEQVSKLNRDLANEIQKIPPSQLNKVPAYLQQISRGTVLLYPLILSNRVEIVLFSSNTPPIHRSVAIKENELENLIAQFRSDLQDNSSLDVKNSSQKLYDILIKPIESELSQAHTILYAPDGKLRYIPLAALYDGKQWLVEKYRISNLIAYNVTDFTQKSKAIPSILAGAYGNGNTKSGQSPLPASISEVREIASTFPNTVNLTNTAFSRAAIELEIPKHNILHLATHGDFNGKPNTSYIFFGNGDTISLSEIKDWKLSNIDLIVLSACQTGVGKLDNGIEILGFGYQVQLAGAKASLASLWKVSDDGTQALMKSFYENIKQGNLTKAEALQKAQVDSLRSNQFSHPFYWSAFILIGNGL